MIQDSTKMGFTNQKIAQKNKKKNLKNFPAGYVGKFYRALAKNIENSSASSFYGRITNDANLPSEDVQKYLLATRNLKSCLDELMKDPYSFF